MINMRNNDNEITENGLTRAEEREILQASAEAEKGINVRGPFDTVEELFEDLRKQSL